MKRILSLFLVVAVLAVCVTGCGKVNKERKLYSNVDLSKCVELGKYKGIAVNVKSDEFKEYYDDVLSLDVENNDFYVQKTTGKVAEGDTANIDYVGKKDGVAFEGGTANGYDLEIGSNSFIDGFEDGLIGVEIGSTVDLNLTFPKGYQNEELAGKAVVFTVKVNYVKTTEALTPDKYYSKLDFKSLDEYTADVTKRATENYLIDAVLDASKVKEYPEEDIDYLYDALKKNVEFSLKNQYGVGFEEYLASVSQTEEEFKKSVITDKIKPMMDTQIALYAIFDEAGLEFEQSEINAQLNKLLNEINQNASVEKQDILDYYGEYYFEELVITEKVTDYIYKNAKITK